MVTPVGATRSKVRIVVTLELSVRVSFRICLPAQSDTRSSLRVCASTHVHLQCYNQFQDSTQEKAHDYGTTSSISDHLEDLHRYLHFQ